LYFFPYYIEHPFLQVGRDHPARFSDQPGHSHREKTRAAAQIQDSHSFIDIGLQNLSRIVNQLADIEVQHPRMLGRANSVFLVFIHICLLRETIQPIHLWQRFSIFTLIFNDY
jgi:hypothetical protein